MLEGTIKWEVACGETLKQELQVWTPIGWLTFVRCAFSCGSSCVAA
jgi:hypothetical protein